MKRLLIPLLAVAALVVPAMASSASVEPTTIEVASVDLKAESLTSTDGTTYFVTDSTASTLRRFRPVRIPRFRSLERARKQDEQEEVR